MQGEDGGQLLHAELLCQLRQGVDVDFGEADCAFQGEDVFFKELRARRGMRGRWRVVW